MMFKSLAAYGQVIGIASLFPYKWPQEIVKLFEVMDMLTSVSDRILNTDCALEDRRGGGLPLVYEKAILYMLAPPIFTACAFVVFRVTQFVLDPEHQQCSCFSWLRKRFLKQGERWLWEDTFRCLIVSVIVAMVVLHPTLTRQSVFLLMCTEIEGRFYLRKDLQLECQTTQHDVMVWFVALPSIFVYVFIWPILVFYVLRQRRHKLHLKGLGGQNTRSTYGFLYRGYSPACFYWEVVIM